MSDPCWNANVVNIAVSIISSSSNRGVVLPRENENFACVRREPTLNLSESDCAKNQGDDERCEARKKILHGEFLVTAKLECRW